jgi:hypothetical protein
MDDRLIATRAIVDLHVLTARQPVVALHASCANDPLYRARRALLRGEEALDEGAAERLWSLQRLAFVVQRPPFVQQPFEVKEGGEHYDEANKVAVLP